MARLGRRRGENRVGKELQRNVQRNGGPMASERLVVIGYSVDEEFAGINTRVLGDAASVAFLRRFPKGERMEVLSRAEALISWNLRRELPAGALQQARALRFIQLLSAGADAVDFAEVPE